MKAENFVELLASQEITFFTGVPDSTLEPFCSYLAAHFDSKNHIIAVNEGGAVALASGYHLATGKIPLVYLQNSGLGNAINPLLSLADPQVYSIPMILLIGWRGKPGGKDEPQHAKQGRVHEALLSAIEVNNTLLNDENEAPAIVSSALALAKEGSCPVVLTCERTFWESESPAIVESQQYVMTREEVLKEVVACFEDAYFFSTTGKTSRELYEIREGLKQGHERDFLTVGSMGHCSQIALGVALSNPRKIVCLDGDGAILMHMGHLGIIGATQPKNFIHILINNGAHESVGGQPTVGFKYNFHKIAGEFGYKSCQQVSTAESLRAVLSSMKNIAGPVFIEVRVRKGSRANLGRPKESPKENKKKFSERLRSTGENLL